MGSFFLKIQTPTFTTHTPQAFYTCEVFIALKYVMLNWKDLKGVTVELINIVNHLPSSPTLYLSPHYLIPAQRVKPYSWWF